MDVIEVYCQILRACDDAIRHAVLPSLHGGVPHTPPSRPPTPLHTPAETPRPSPPCATEPAAATLQTDTTDR